MQLGVFAKTFPCPSIELNLDAVVACQFTCTQYNLSCAGLSTLPDELSVDKCRNIARAHRDRSLTMAAISGTFNIIDDNRKRLASNMIRFRILAEHCSSLETKVITLCTGSLDPDDMWRWHPKNASQAAWDRMLTSLREIVEIAAAEDIYVAIEPEINNVVDSARKARQALDEIGSPHLKIVFDAANLIPKAEIARSHAIIEEAIDLLAKDVVICHAKELDDPGGNRKYNGPLGRGALDFDHYIGGLRRRGVDVPLIVHGIRAVDLPSSKELLDSVLAAVAPVVASEA